MLKTLTHYVTVLGRTCMKVINVLIKETWKDSLHFSFHSMRQEDQNEQPLRGPSSGLSHADTVILNFQL